MSRRSPKPDSSVAVMASMSSTPALSSSRMAAIDCPATAAVPWPMTRTRVIVPAARRAAIVGRQRPRRRRSARSGPSVSTILPPQRLGQAVGRLGDLLEQEVRAVAAVDVAGRHLGHGDVGLGRPAARSRRSRGGGCPSTRAGGGGVEHDDLAAVLAVEADVALGLLDDAVRLAGHDVAVVGEADVDALAAAVERQVQAARLVGGGGPDGDRALERRHRAAERVEQVAAARLAVAGHERGDDLGVGRDRTREAQAHAGRVRSAWLSTSPLSTPTTNGGTAPPRCSELVAVDGVGVGLGDDADAGPAGVAEHGELGPGAAQGQAQQGVGGDGLAHHPGVVAELADLGRRLVHDRQGPAGEAGGAGLEQRVAAALGERGDDGGIVDVEVVVPHEDVDAGRVAAADLHAVDRRQRLLDRQVPAERGRRRRRGRPGRRRPAPCAAGRGGWPTARRAARSTRRWPAPARRGRATARGEGGVDVGGVGVELVEPGRDRGRRSSWWSARARTPGSPRSASSTTPRRGGDGAGVTAGGQRGVEPAEQLVARRRRTGRGTADDADDAAHGGSGY